MQGKGPKFKCGFIDTAAFLYFLAVRICFSGLWWGCYSCPRRLNFAGILRVFPALDAGSAFEQTEAQQDLFYWDTCLATCLSCMWPNKHWTNFDKPWVVLIEGKAVKRLSNSALTFLLNLVEQFVPTAKFLEPCNILFLIFFCPVLAFLPVYTATCLCVWFWGLAPCCVFFLINTAPFQAIFPVCDYVKELSKLSFQGLLIC